MTTYQGQTAKDEGHMQLLCYIMPMLPKGSTHSYIQTLRDTVSYITTETIGSLCTSMNKELCLYQN